MLTEVKLYQMQFQEDDNVALNLNEKNTCPDTKKRFQG